MKVAALFVDEAGPYAMDPRFDAWGITRDARNYCGPAPVVTHPPCPRWGRYWITAPAGAAGLLGDDGGAVHVSLVHVRAKGGVMEHPENSNAWEWFGLPVPPARGWSPPDQYGGRSCRIEQGNYGHPCRKATWIYAVLPVFPEMRWGASSATGLIESLSSTNPWRWRTPDQLKDALHDMAASCIGWTPVRGPRQRRLRTTEDGGRRD